MFIRGLRTNAPEQDQVNSAIAIARTLEHKERSRVSTVLEARHRIASRLRIGVGTFENLVRGRVKRIDATIRDRLQALLVRELEGEIARLMHDLGIARQCGEAPNSDQMGEIEAHLSKARALLNAGPPR